MVINGYLLLDFFHSEVNSLLLGFIVCFCAAAYVAFIVYLVSLSGALSSTWTNLLTNGFSFSGIKSINSDTIVKIGESTANSS